VKFLFARSHTELDLDDVVRGCERLVADVDDWVRAQLRLEVRDVVEV
jgi:hypothetical protein